MRITERSAFVLFLPAGSPLWLVSLLAILLSLSWLSSWVSAQMLLPGNATSPAAQVSGFGNPALGSPSGDGAFPAVGVASGQTSRDSTLQNPAASQPEVTLRFTWGGGVARRWHGTLDYQGAEPNAAWRSIQLMSIQQDAPGSVLPDPATGQLRIRTLEASTYGSFQASVPADLNAVIVMGFHGSRDSARAVNITASLKDILSNGFRAALDDQGNGIWIERPKSDRVRWLVPDEVPFVEAGTRWPLGWQSIQAGWKPGTEVEWSTRLIPMEPVVDSTATRWQDQGTVTVDADGNLKAVSCQEFMTPQIPGVYDLELRVTPARNNMLAFVNRESLVRRVQIVVGIPGHPTWTDRQSTSVQIAADQLSQAWGKLAEAPRWNMFPRLNPLGRPSAEEYLSAGSDSLTVQHDDDGGWWNLGPGQWRTIEVTNLEQGSYWLQATYRNPGEGRLAITVLQSDGQGKLANLQSGSGMVHHPWMGMTWSNERNEVWRQPVWVNRRSAMRPVVLLLQNAGKDSVQIGNLDWLSMDDKVWRPEAGRRSAELYLQTPLLPTAMHAPKSEIEQELPSLNDWKTLWLAVGRMSQWMQEEQLQTLWFPVLTQGGSLYESDRYRTSLRYENSGFASGYQHQGKLDVVELLARQLDQDGLSFVPVLDFSGGMESVERRFLEAGQVLPQGDGNGVYYPLLHPLVQQSIQEIALDFVHRYQHHGSFQGMAISLGPDSHLVFDNDYQGCEWLPALEAFAQETGNAWPQAELGPMAQSTLAQRVSWVQGPIRKEWLAWRASKVTLLLQQLGQSIRQASGRSDFPITIIAENWLSHPAVKPAAYPNLRSRLDWISVSLQLGMDLESLTAAEQPFQFCFQWGASPEERMDRQRAGKFEYHQEQFWRLQQTRNLAPPIFQDGLEVLDLSGVLIAGTRHAGLQTLVSYQNPARRLARWSESLWCQDCRTLKRQSWGAGVGSSPAERAFLESFSQLPDAAFQTVFEDGNCSVVIRQQAGDGRQVYLVNAAPWSVEVMVPGLRSGVSITTQSRDAEGRLLTVKQTAEGGLLNMPAYSLMVLQANEVVSWENVVVKDQEGVRQTLAELKEQLFQKLKYSGQAKPWQYLTNGDFDQSKESLEGWTFSQLPGHSVQLESELSYSGTQSLHVTNQQGVVWIRSQPMVPVSTGRVSVAAWLRMHPKSPHRKIRLSLDAETVDGRKYYRFAEIELDPAQGNSWQPVAAHFDDLPEEGLTQFRIGFDLMEPSEFWIDSVHCFDRWLDPNDQKVLSNRLGVLSYTLQSGPQSFGGYRMLQDYWLNFLHQHIQNPQAAASESSEEVTAEAGLPNWSSRMKRRIFSFR